MIAVIQRVLEASVKIHHQLKSEIGYGYLILLGVEEADNEEDIEWLAAKIANLRIMDDENRVMNKSILDTGGDILVVSQFTLHASIRKGNRPSYIKAAKPEQAVPLYLDFIEVLKIKTGREIKTGEFGADMQVSLVNDGPVTLIIDTKNKK
jgi:D-tyrosyl-tRNA(Tyr) deacylase